MHFNEKAAPQSPDTGDAGLVVRSHFGMKLYFVLQKTGAEGLRLRSTANATKPIV